MAFRILFLFSAQKVSKMYYACVRGWVEPQGHIDHPLSSEHDPTVKKESQTDFRRIATVEIPSPVGKYSTARYSLVEVRPRTGRLHQIRRHFAHLSHPLIGDRSMTGIVFSAFARFEAVLRHIPLICDEFSLYSIAITRPDGNMNES